MTQLYSQSLKLFLVFSLTATLLFSTLVSPRVYAQSQLPPPTTHISDVPGVVPEPARQQLENILANLQQRSEVNVILLVVETTGGVDVGVYSGALAREWKIGQFTGSGKSMLLVVSVAEKTSIIQATRQLRRDFPEGLPADVVDLMRSPLNSGRVADALLLGVQKIVGALAVKLGFNAEGMDQAPAAAAKTADEAGASTQPRPTPAVENAGAKPAEESKTTAEPRSPAPEATGNKPIGETANPETSSAGEGPGEPIKPTASKETRKNDANRKKSPATDTAKTSASKTAKPTTPEDDQAEAELVTLTLAEKDLDKRIEKLKDFIATHPESKSKARATEFLIVTRARIGDDKLKAGQTAAGVELLFLALKDAQPEMSDRLFSVVISQIPLNLYARGEATAAFKAAQEIEAKVANNPKRLLALSGFYLEIERGDEAARVAEQAVKLAPDLAEARNALGLALHISLRLDEAAAEYRRALDLDPKTRGARRALADMYRASGKFEEALALYREQLTDQPDDQPARVGLVLSLFELGKVDEGKTELQAALEKDPRNLALLTAAGYWFVAHGQSSLGLTLAQQAAGLEPRYTWAQITLARALLAEKQPLLAERSIRFARQYGRFPTLEYELATTLASVGLYEEASQILVQAFSLKDGQLETRLANRIPARAASFSELLAPERRASIFQPAPADTEANASSLKTLLSFTLALNPQGAAAKIDEDAVAALAREFAAGKDDMRAYRQLYAASRLLQRGIALQTVQELSEAARVAVDAATLVPAVTVAAQADELADLRARAIAVGGTPDVPEAPRNVLANILRGRIEEISGWAFFKQDKTAEAVEHLRRAVGILPVGTPLWQTSNWHLGVALQQSGQDAQALTAYIKSYSTGAPDAVRRSIIEQLYKKVNGSLEGLDDRIGPAAPVTSNTAPAEKTTAPLPEAAPTPGPTPTPEPVPQSTSSATPETTPTPTASPEARPSPSPAAEATPTPAATPEPSPAPTPTPEPSKSPEPTPAPTPESAPEPKASPSPEATPAAEPSATPTPESSPTRSRDTSTPATEKVPTPSPTPPGEIRPRRVKPPR